MRNLFPSVAGIIEPLVLEREINLSLQNEEVGMNIIEDIYHSFMEGWRCGFLHKREKELRDSLSESQVDHMVEDSFPASDPPSTY